MKFSNLSRRLGDYAAQGAITQEDALSLISRLCDDVRFETGAPVDRCQVRDWDRLIDELFAIGNTVNTLYEKHKKTILEMEQTDTEDDLWQKLRTVEADCRKAKERLGKLEGVRKELSQAEEDLRRQVSAEREMQADAELRRQRIAALEGELEQLRNGDMQELTRKCQALEEEKRQTLAQRQQLDAQLHRQEQELAPVREALEQQKQHYASLSDRIAQTQAQLESLQTDCRNREQELQTENESLAAKLRECELLKSTAQEERNRHADCQQALAAARQEAQRLDQLLAAAEAERNRQTGELEELKASLQTRQTEAQTLAATRLELEQALEKAGTNVGEDRQKIASMREALTVAEAEAAEIATELVSVQSRFEAQQTDNRIFREEKLAKAQQLLEQGKAETQTLSEELVELEKKLSASKEERTEIGAKINEINTFLIVQQKLLDEKKQEHDRKAAERDELNAQVRRMTAGIDGLLEEINKRTEQLEGMDKEKIEADLRQDQENLQAQIEALELSQQQSQALRAQIAEKTAEVEAAQAQLDELTAQKAGQENIHSLLERNLTDLREKLGALASPEHTERVERCRRQVEILHRLRHSLEQNAAQIGCGWSFDLPKDLIAQVQTAEKTLQTLQTAIQEYTALRQSELST